MRKLYRRLLQLKSNQGDQKLAFYYCYCLFVKVWGEEGWNATKYTCFTLRCFGRNPSVVIDDLLLCGESFENPSLFLQSARTKVDVVLK